MRPRVTASVRAPPSFVYPGHRSTVRYPMRTGTKMNPDLPARPDPTAAARPDPTAAARPDPRPPRRPRPPPPAAPPPPLPPPRPAPPAPAPPPPRRSDSRIRAAGAVTALGAALARAGHEVV